MTNAPAIPTVSPATPTRPPAWPATRCRRRPAAPLIVDVREPDEFAAERVAGRRARCRSRSSSPRHEELPKDRPLLMICAAGSRSASATMFLLQRGWTDVRNVDGGMLAWARDGLPVRTGPPAEGEGDLPALSDRLRAQARACSSFSRRRRSRHSRICGRWANAQPMITRIAKLTIPTAFAAR